MKSVFISSTSKDLIPHREAVKKTIERLELRPIDMLNFGSRDGDATEVSLEEVRKADFFIGIIANRYGYVPDGMDKSVTEQEYDEATRRKIPRLMYLVDNTYLVKLPDDDPMRMHGGDAPERLKAFKDRINMGQVRSLFTTPDNLANQASADLSRHLAEQQRHGRSGAIVGGAMMILALITLLLMSDSGIRQTLIVDSGLEALIAPTPIEFSAGTEEDFLVVIADFNVQREAYNPQDEIYEAMLNAIADDSRIRVEKTRRSFTSSEEARAFSESSVVQADYLIWGKAKTFAGGQEGYEFYFETLTELVPTYYQVEETRAASASYPETLVSFARSGMDAGYVVNFAVGGLHTVEDNPQQALRYLTQAENVLVQIPTREQTDDNLKVAEFYFAFAYNYQVLEDYQQAVRYYERAIEINPRYAFAYTNQGLIHADLGEYEQAMQDYDKAIEFDPDLTQAYGNRGNVYVELGEYRQAISDYDKAIELDPDLAQAYGNRGNAYVGLGEYRQAISDYDKAIELDPEYKKVYINRGNAYTALGEYEQAILNYDEAIELDPEYRDAYYNRGLAHYTLEQYGQAIQDYDQAIQLDPEYALAYNNRGLIYSDLRQYEQAIQDYNRAIQLDPEYALAYNNRGLIYSDLRQYEQAIQDYDQAIQLDSDHVLSYTNRGLAYSALGQHERAIQDYNQAIQFDPDYTPAYLNRGIAYASLGQFEKMAQDFLQYLQLGSLEIIPNSLTESETTVEMAENHAYTFEISLDAGQLVTLSATSVEVGQVDPLIVLVNPENIAVMANDDISAENFDSMIENFEVPEGGIYTLWVSHAGGGSEGMVAVNVTMTKE